MSVMAAKESHAASDCASADLTSSGMSAGKTDEKHLINRLSSSGMDSLDVMK
jgi:hypothetical protein